ncbi:TPA: hypothetical protein ACQ7LZ_003455 [Klebsiella pneumoniae]
MSSETSLRSQLELPNDQQIDVLAAILDKENEQATSARSMSTEPQEVLEKHPSITPFKDLVSKASEIVLTKNGNDIAQCLRSILENKNDYLNHRDEAVSLSIALNISQYIAPRFRALPPSPKRTSDDEPNQLSIDRQVIDMHWTWIQGQKKAVGAEEFEHLFQREEFDWILAEKFARLNWTTDVKIRALQINVNLQWELAQYQSKKHRDSWRKLQKGDVRGGKLHSLGIAQVTERLEVSVTKRRNLAKHIPHWVNVWLASRISDKSYMSLAQIMRFMTGESHDEKRLKSSLKAVLQRLDSYEKKM